MFPRKAKPNDVTSSIQRFVDLRRDPASRVKHLKAVLDSIVNLQEKRQLLEDYSFEAFHLVDELLLLVDFGLSSSSSSTASNRSAIEAEFALWTLEQILVYLPDLISHRWQYHAIESVLKKCLHPQNVNALRKIAIRLFLLWYQTLGANKSTSDQLDMVFVCLLPHFPLRIGGSGATTTESLLQRYCETTTGVVNGSTIMAPSPIRCVPLVGISSGAPLSQSTKERAQTLQLYLDKFLDYVCRETSRLEWAVHRADRQLECARFLVARMRTLYIDTCFPELTGGGGGIDLYKMAAGSDGGATNRLPPISEHRVLDTSDPLVISRYWLIRWLTQYVYSHRVGNQSDSLNQSDSRLMQLSKEYPTDETAAAAALESRLPPGYHLYRCVFFESATNINMVLSLLREGFLLPIPCSHVINKVFRTVREWLLQEDVPVFMLDRTTHPLGVGATKSTQLLLNMLTCFFHSPYLRHLDGDRQQTAFHIAQRILGVLKDLANPQRTNGSPNAVTIELNADAWCWYLRSLLAAIEQAMPESPTTTNSSSALTVGIASSLFQTVLCAWVFVGAVRAVHLPDALWNDALIVFASRTDWSELIDEWGKMVDSVTRALALYLYDIDLFDLPIGERALTQTTATKRITTGRARFVDNNNVTTELASPPPTTGGGGDNNYNFLQHTKLTSTTSASVTDEFARMNIANAGDRSIRAQPQSARYVPSGSAEFVDQHSAIDSGRSSSGHAGGGVADAASSIDDDKEGSIDSASFTGVGLGLSSAEQSVSGVMLASSPMFGDDRDSLTPSPHMSNSNDDDDDGQLIDDHFGIHQDKIEENDASTPRDDTNGTVWMLVWRRMIAIIGNINNITDPINQMKAMHVLTRTIDSLIKVDTCLDDDTSSVRPPIHWLLPCLLTACDSAQTSVDTRRDATGALCRAVSHLQQRANNIDLLAEFVVCIERALRDNYQLAGIVFDSLTPAMFFEYAAVFNESLQPVAIATIQRIVADSASLRDKTRPIQYAAVMASSSMCDNKLTADAIMILTNAINITDLNADALAMCINGLSLLAITNCTRSDISENTALDALISLLTTGNNNRIVALLICQNLYAIVDLLPQLPHRNVVCTKILTAYGSIIQRVDRVDDQLALHIITQLVDLAIRQLIGDTTIIRNMISAMVLLQSRVDANCRSTALMQLLQLITYGGDQFPLPTFDVSQVNSIEMVTSGDDQQRKLSKNTDDSSSVFIANGQTLVSASIHSANIADDGRLSLVSRSIAGKHCWSVRHMTTVTKPKRHSLNNWLLLVGCKSKNSTMCMRSSMDIDSDPLYSLCEHLSVTSPECIPHAQFPDSCPEPILAHEADVKAAVHQCSARVEQHYVSSSIDCDQRTRSGGADASSWQWRTLIGDLAQIDQSRCQPPVDRTHFARLLRHLDQQLVREVHKIAVIYVADGQHDKSSILANRIGSYRFEQFVARLGWPIDVRDHAGYAGGLSSTDCHARTPYYASLNVELIWHVSTRLAADDETKRLRHIGNDEVQVIWSEDWRVYQRTTIATKFGDVLIVIQTTGRHDYYRVSIETSRQLVFGPLFDGAIVHWLQLPTLVRLTAINASRAYRLAADAQWTQPAAHRTAVLQSTVDQLHEPRRSMSTLSASAYAPHMQWSTI